MKKEGGHIMNGRVGGNLLITRSLGDFDMKKYGVSSDPEMYSFDLKEP